MYTLEGNYDFIDGVYITFCKIQWTQTSSGQKFSYTLYFISFVSIHVQTHPLQGCLGQDIEKIIKKNYKKEGGK